jgi:excinuclease ABC subunit B
LVGEAKEAEELVRALEERVVRELEEKPRMKNRLIEALEKEMWHAAKDWDFERAAKIRDQIEKLKRG